MVSFQHYGNFACVCAASVAAILAATIFSGCADANAGQLQPHFSVLIPRTAAQQPPAEGYGALLEQLARTGALYATRNGALASGATLGRAPEGSPMALEEARIASMLADAGYKMAWIGWRANGLGQMMSALVKGKITLYVFLCGAATYMAMHADRLRQYYFPALGGAEGRGPLKAHWRGLARLILGRDRGGGALVLGRPLSGALKQSVGLCLPVGSILLMSPEVSGAEPGGVLANLQHGVEGPEPSLSAFFNVVPLPRA